MKGEFTKKELKMMEGWFEFCAEWGVFEKGEEEGVEAHYKLVKKIMKLSGSLK